MATQQKNNHIMTFTYNTITWLPTGGTMQANINGIQVAILTPHTFDAMYTLTMFMPFTAAGVVVSNQTQAETAITAALNSALNAVINTCI